MCSLLSQMWLVSEASLAFSLYCTSVLEKSWLHIPQLRLARWRGHVPSETDPSFLRLIPNLMIHTARRGPRSFLKIRSANPDGSETRGNVLLIDARTIIRHWPKPPSTAHLTLVRKFRDTIVLRISPPLHNPPGTGLFPPFFPSIQTVHVYCSRVRILQTYIPRAEMKSDLTLPQ